MTDVAVVIPAYNPGKRLKIAVESVLAQDVDAEVVVVDDGGSEDLSWLAGYPVRHHRQANAGVSAARNVGVTLTAAPLVAFLDQDDEWLPGKLRTQLDAIGDAALSLTDFMWRPSGEPAVHPYPATAQSLAAGGHFCLSTLLVRRDAFWRAGGFNPALRMQQDHDLVMRMLALGGEDAHVFEPLANYWLHESNQSADYARAMTERLLVLRQAALLGLDVSEGLVDARRVYGAQAFAAFRSSRRPADLGRALRWNPRHVAQGAVRR